MKQTSLTKGTYKYYKKKVSVTERANTLYQKNKAQKV